MRITVTIEGARAEGKTTAAGVIARALRELGASVTVEDDEATEGGTRPPGSVLAGTAVTVEVRQTPL